MQKIEKLVEVSTNDSDRIIMAIRRMANQLSMKTCRLKLTIGIGYAPWINSPIYIYMVNFFITTKIYNIIGTE